MQDSRMQLLAHPARVRVVLAVAMVICVFAVAMVVFGRTDGGVAVDDGEWITHFQVRRGGHLEQATATVNFGSDGTVTVVETSGGRRLCTKHGSWSWIREGETMLVSMDGMGMGSVVQVGSSRLTVESGQRVVVWSRK